MRTILQLLLAMLLAGTPAAAWQITGYDTRMEVQEDSSVLVEERITADFSGDPHHGIYREIPLSGSDSYGNRYRIRFELTAVTDANNVPQTRQVRTGGGRVNIRIGDPDIYAQGVQTYVIRYRLLRAVHFFDEHDEIYWNVVGPEWQVPISSPTCVVTIPGAASEGRLRATSFTGMYGSTKSDAIVETPDDRTVTFRVDRELYPGEYMTVVVGWPKGIVKPPSFGQEAVWFVSDNGYFFLPPLFLLALGVWWYREGRDPDTGRSVVVNYDPPDDIHPAEMGTLIDESADMRDISATIIDLAVRGHIVIEAEKQRGFLSSRTDHTLKLTSPYSETMKNPDLNEYERELVQALFAGLDFCVMSNLEGKFYTNLPRLRDMLYDAVIHRGYFNRRPDEVRRNYLALGIALVVVGLIVAFLSVADGGLPLNVPVGWPLAVAVCGVFLAIAARYMPRCTAAGKNAYLKVKGFEEYLSRAESAEIEYQERQGFFEKFLPYAMALGIADNWARAFEGLQTEPPNWYVGDYDVFRPRIFVHDLTMATNGWGRTMSTQPRSEGGRGGGGGSSFFGGGSGFSGGFSGGGGGGGGGGGW